LRTAGSLVLIVSLVACIPGESQLDAAIFGIVNGWVEDSQHRPVPQAAVTIRSRLSSWQAQTESDATGRFSFPAVPAGDYVVSVVKQGFQTVEQPIAVRSPRGRRAQAHLAYAHQFVEGRGAVTGGLTAFEPPSDDFFFLDHDQRDTMTAGVNLTLADDAVLSASVEYGSGFLEGDGPAHHY
jgi:hypothetical protein